MESVSVDRGVTLVRRGPVWHLVVHRDGDRFRKSLATRDRAKAIVVARQLAADMAGGRWNIRLAGASVRSTVARYLWTESRRHHVPHTRKLVRAVLVREWIPYLKTLGIVEIGSVRRETVEDFLASRDRNLSPATRNRSLSWVRAFLQWAHVHEHTRVNAAEGVRMLRVPSRVKYTPTRDEIARIAAKCYSTTTRDLVLLLANTGLRLGEALDIKKSDFNAGGQRLLVRSPKVHAERVLPLNAVALDILSRRSLAASAGGYIFATENGTPLDRHNAARAIRTAVGKAKVNGVSAHAFRRAFATTCAAVMPAIALQKLGGWSSPTVVAKFYVGAAVVGAPPPVVAS